MIKSDREFLNNRVIKWQYSGKQCECLSNLYLQYGCIPFERMPYCTSLRQHNPKIYDLMEAIPNVEREHELFARLMKNSTEIEGRLFTNMEEINGFENIGRLESQYNSTLYYKHGGRRLKEYKNHIY